MSQKTILLFVLIFFFSYTRVVFAGLVINEIMYDLSGSDSTSSKSREWIEVYNNGTSDINVDASTWRIYDGSLNRTINGEVNFSVSSGGYVIFAGDKDTFLVDHPGYSGIVYDTGITTLNNTGATLKILDQDGNMVDSVIYTSTQGGAGDGNSLQKISGNFSGAIPTPGVANEVVSVPSYPTPSSGNSPSTLSNPTSGGTGEDIYVSTSKKEQKIRTEILAKNITFAGVPVEFKANTFGYSGETLFYGKYFWNFGDGDFKEMRVNEVEKFTHTYFYPGEYVVNLEYFMNYNSENPEVVNKIILKVIEPNVSISSVGDEKDFFVEISNDTNFDADISRWVLRGNLNSFIIPRNTILGSKKKIILSPKITNLAIEDKGYLKLLTPQMEVVCDYNSSLVEVKKESEVKTNKTNNSVSNYSPQVEIPMGENKNTENETGDLAANTAFLGKVDNNQNSYLSIFIFAIFLSLTSLAVYFIRHRKKVFSEGEDFELLDE